jgi:hypothetical protein
MAELLDLSGDELVLDVASGIFPAESDSDQGLLVRAITGFKWKA